MRAMKMYAMTLIFVNRIVRMNVTKRVVIKKLMNQILVGKNIITVGKGVNRGLTVM